MKVANIAVWDIETGGFKKDDNGLCEIAMIVIDGDTLQELDRFETIIAPYEQPSGQMSTYTPGAEAVHGISITQINNGMPAKQAAKEIKAFCLKHKVSLRGGNGKLVCAGHNHVKFDIPWLRHFLELFNVDFDTLFQPIILDTLLWTRLKWSRDGSIANHQLGTAASASGIELIDSHRAMPDTEANAELVKSFLRALRQQSQVVQVDKKRKRETFKF
jgi:DNA polymerase III epsilon subunit-like protein